MGSSCPGITLNGTLSLCLAVLFARVVTEAYGPDPSTKCSPSSALAVRAGFSISLDQLVPLVCYVLGFKHVAMED